MIKDFWKLNSIKGFVDKLNNANMFMCFCMKFKKFLGVSVNKAKYIIIKVVIYFYAQQVSLLFGNILDNLLEDFFKVIYYYTHFIERVYYLVLNDVKKVCDSVTFQIIFVVSISGRLLLSSRYKKEQFSNWCFSIMFLALSFSP